MAGDLVPGGDVSFEVLGHIAFDTKALQAHGAVVAGGLELLDPPSAVLAIGTSRLDWHILQSEI